MRNAELEETQAGIKIARRNINKSSKAGDNGMKLQLLYVVALIAPVLCQMPPMVALTP